MNIAAQLEVVPSMADAYDMVHIAQSKFQQLVGQDTASIGEAKQAVVCEYSSQSHCSRMQYCLVAQIAETGMPVYNFDALPYYDIAEYWEKGEDGREGRFAVDDEERDVIDFQAIGEVSNTRPSGICMRYDYDFVTTINEFLRCFNTGSAKTKHELRAHA